MLPETSKERVGRPVQEIAGTGKLITKVNLTMVVLLPLLLNIHFVLPPSARVAYLVALGGLLASLILGNAKTGRSTVLAPRERQAISLLTLLASALVVTSIIAVLRHGTEMIASAAVSLAAAALVSYIASLVPLRIDSSSIAKAILLGGQAFLIGNIAGAFVQGNSTPIIQSELAHAWGLEVDRREFPLAGSGNGLGIVAVAIGGTMLALLGKSQSFLRNAWGASVFVFSVYVIIALDYRAGLVLIFVPFIYWQARLSLIRRILAVSAVLSVFIFPIVVGMAIASSNQLLLSNLDQSGRPTIWRAAIDSWPRSPYNVLVGYGPDSEALLGLSHYLGVAQQFATAHSTVLQLLVTGGLLLLIPFLAAFVWLAWQSHRQSTKIQVCIGGMIVAITLTGMFEAAATAAQFETLVLFALAIVSTSATPRLVY